jgi:hypothetical protein
MLTVLSAQRAVYQNATLVLRTFSRRGDPNNKGRRDHRGQGLAMGHDTYASNPKIEDCTKNLAAALLWISAIAELCGGNWGVAELHLQRNHSVNEGKRNKKVGLGQLSRHVHIPIRCMITCCCSMRSTRLRTEQSIWEISVRTCISLLGAESESKQNAMPSCAEVCPQFRQVILPLP